MQSIKEANQQNPVPILMSVDQEGGKVSRMPEAVESIPSNRKVGKTNDTKLAEKMGALLARQIKLAGFNVDFAPVLDINSNPKIQSLEIVPSALLLTWLHVWGSPR